MPISPAPGPDALVDRYPEFAGVPEALRGLVLADAAEMVDVTWRTADQVPAVLAYAAHLLAMEGEPARSAAVAAGGTSTAAGALGAVKRIKVGDVETEFSGAPAASAGGASGGSDMWLAASAYGQTFLRLRRRNFPAVAVI